LNPAGHTQVLRDGAVCHPYALLVGEDDVLIEIHPQVSSLNTALDAGPRVDTREAHSKVIVKNGQTVVIAGLMRQDKTVIRQKVPFFGNLPLIGLAFRNKSTDFVKRELAVFITPFIQKPMLPAEDEVVHDKRSAHFHFERALRMVEEYGIESYGTDRRERYAESAKLFRAVIRNYPESEEADDALYHLGSIYFEELNDYERAAQAWDQLRIGYPGSPYLTRQLRMKLRAAKRRAERGVVRLRKKKS